MPSEKVCSRGGSRPCARLASSHIVLNPWITQCISLHRASYEHYVASAELSPHGIAAYRVDAHCRNPDWWTAYWGRWRCTLQQ
jgi:hypothetical protein